MNMAMNPQQIIQERQRRSEAASLLQQKAVRPQHSVLVGASAGTGKTYVLTRRFLRVLLQDETCRPADILAVTFTKAAAAEMRNRVTKTLMNWATYPDAKLQKELIELLQTGDVSAEMMQRARSLFPMVLDDGSSLKILTIHSFCQSLLSQFPLEAELPPGFGVIEGRESDELIHQSIQQMYQTAPLQKEGGQWAFEYLVSTAADTTMVELFKKFLNARRRFERLLRHKPLGHLLDDLAMELGLGFTPDLVSSTPENITAEAQQYFIENLLQNRTTLKEMHDVMAEGGKSDKDVALALDVFLAATTPQAQADALPYVRSSLLTQAGTPATRPFTKKLQEAHPSLYDAFLELQDAFVKEAEQANALKVYLKTAAFLTLTNGVLNHYKNLKAKQGSVDFEDLIYYAQRLLSEEAARGDWVRFKMDGRISHIMLDEAQDTDSDQWHILRSLVEEFFSGKGQYDGTLDRTFFAVGDIKQSIYRFRGAQPHVFGGMVDEVQQMAAPVGHEVVPVGLNTSFRSSDVVLDLVDAVFNGGKYRKAVDGEEGPLEHKAWRLGVGGRVELWPLYAKTKANRSTPKGPEDWKIPGLDDEAADENAAQSPRDIMFADMAKRLRDLVDEKPFLGATGRHLEPSDILVLFRSKTSMQTFVNALAAEGLLATISGEIDLATEPAIGDLMAVIRFLANPSDTLSLVHAVRSPLFGLTDAQLEEWRKNTKDGRSYWASLMAMTEEPFAKTATLLKDLLNNIDAATPYQTLLTLLDQTEGRARLAACYTGSTKGAAADTLNMVIDGFLNAALDYARSHSPSLLGFISWFDKGALPLKLEASKSPGAIQLMTVHGSKGLEAGVVVLPEATKSFYGSNVSKEAFLWQTDALQNDSLMMCTVSGKPEAPLQASLKEAERQAIFDDEMRLLYVALTRACDYLIIAGYEDNPKPDETYYSIIAAQTEHLNWQVDEATGRKVINAEAVAVKQEPYKPATPPADTPLPEWMFVKAEEVEAPKQFQVATDDGQQRKAADLSANQENIYRKGLLVHRLLEVLPFLPADERTIKGQSFLNYSAADLPTETREKLLESALETIKTHGDLFDEHAQGEVALAAGNMGGRVDLLRVTENDVMVVDYKTNVNPPETIPSQYRKQLQAYAKAAAEIWPTKTVKCAILWVNDTPPRLHWLDS